MKWFYVKKISTNSRRSSLADSNAHLVRHIGCLQYFRNSKDLYVIYNVHKFFCLHINGESVSRRCSVKKVLLEISQNSQENISARVTFLINLQAKACNFIKKETLAQVFSCEFCKFSKNTFSSGAHPMAASINGQFKIVSLVVLMQQIYGTRY